MAESGDPRVTNLTVEEVARGLQEGRMLLVDVREPNEIAVERYPDAVVVPLSGFDPKLIPDPQGKQGLVLAIGTLRGQADATLVQTLMDLVVHGERAVATCLRIVPAGPPFRHPGGRRTFMSGP